MRSQEAAENKALAAAAPSRRRGRRRRRKSPPEVTVKAQLRMRSPSGVFVMVGISVVLVGMTIAVVGYWPHRAGAGSGNASSPGEVRKEVAHNRHFPHSEKLKLIGPVIMGIGLFIFICANTMLYENRDMETRLLMQKGLYGMAAGLPAEPGAEDKYCETRTSQAVPADGVEGCYEVDLASRAFQMCAGSKWSECYRAKRLQTTAQLLHHNGASPSASLLSVRSGNSAEGNLNLSFSPGADSSTLPRGQEHQDNHVVISMEGVCPVTPTVETPLPSQDTEEELSSDPQLHNPGHSKSLDLGRPGVLLVAPIKDRKNRSWPRLDHLSLVAYAKLGNTGESSDMLLEQRGRQEARPGSWEVGTERGSRV
ncbi:PREDICTED: transmembrane protein 200B [Tinamus guttatus]|uniref:transmembrane protein 200B n=1 Tax=Tinamus guttatus TaxID=94827 RepID=UPI00052EA549|nr:PREDICTED: transmembrane protein 200B [Tinamus guttatus]